MKAASGYRSKLAQARGMGSAKEGVGHWWFQRVTALALIPLCFWFMSALLELAKSNDPFRLADWMASPFHAVAMAALVIALFWHAKLGLQVVIEDYVHTPLWKYVWLLANNFFCWGAGIVCIVAVIRLHLFSLVTGV